MTSRALARVVIGEIIPNRAVDKFDIPVPYRATVDRSRANWKVKGSQLDEPSEVAELPITENPTP